MALDIPNLAVGVGTGLLGMIGQRARERRAVKNQEHLMGVQLKNQQVLNEQGNELQMDMWNKTNYGAQMEHLKDAGLNPSLMYGMKGGGGVTTGSQGGGSAQGGNAPAPQPMEIGTMLQASLLNAQTEKIKAETENLKRDAELKGEQTTETYQRGYGTFLENIIKKWEMGDSGDVQMVGNKKYGWEGMTETSVRGQRAILDNENKKLSNDEIMQKLKNMEVEKILNEADIKLTEEQTRQVYHKILQDWANTGLKVLDSASIIGMVKNMFKK